MQKDAAIQSITNQPLEITKDGSYLYVDSHFVLNHPKYVKRDLFGETVLTKYARTHMDECCLVFDLSIRSGVKERYHNECFLNRDQTSTISFDVVYGKGYQHATPEKQSELLASVLTENARIYAELPNCYIASLQKVREWRDITYDELAERILIDARTIRRIMNGETNGSILSLVWICLGLHLPPEISNHIIDKSPHSLNYTNDSHVYYRFAINHLYAKKVEEIRAFLLRQGAET